MNNNGYLIEFGDELDQDIGSASSGSEGIDSDVEDKIMSHLYYQTNEMVAANSTPMRNFEASATLPLPSAILNADKPQGPAVTEDAKRRSAAKIETLSPKASGSETYSRQYEQQEEEESKYSIKPKRNGSYISALHHMDSDTIAADTRSEAADHGKGRLSQKTDHNSDEEGQSFTVTMVPAYRPATATDGEDEPEVSGKTKNTTVNGNDATSGVSGLQKGARNIAFNSSDHSAVNGYLDEISSSRLATPRDTRTTSTDNTPLDTGVMEQQVVQIDALLSPTALSADAAAGSMVHITPVKRQRADDEGHEYDYLDEAEIQGHNRYFMEEKEIICRRCHKAGHIAKDCTTVACTVCGKEGHASKDCKQSGVVCHSCNMRGHIMSECPQRSGKHKNRHLPRPSTCDRCDSRYHHTEECATIWRRYVYTDPLPSQYNAVMPWCYNCADEGHFGDECHMPPSRAAAGFRGDTAFNSQNCRGKVLSIVSPKRSNNTSNRDHPSYYSSDTRHRSKSGGRSTSNRTPSRSRKSDIRGSSKYTTPRRSGGKFRHKNQESPWSHKTPTGSSRHTSRAKTAEDSGGGRFRHSGASRSASKGRSKKH